MEKTRHYNLNKPTQTDYYNIDDFNENADILDAAMHALDEKPDGSPTPLWQPEATAAHDIKKGSLCELVVSPLRIAQPAAAPGGSPLITSLQEFNGQMYLAVKGGGSDANAVEIYRFNDSSNMWDRLPKPSNIPNALTSGIQMCVFNGRLFLALTHNSLQGVSLWEWNGTSWVNTGLAAPSMTLSSDLRCAMISFDGRLHLFIASRPSGVYPHSSYPLGRKRTMGCCSGEQ
jgi:hypothetical protein